MSSIAETAKCKDTECDFDVRKKGKGTTPVKTAGDMNRVNIIREEMTFRTVPKDFGAKGTITIDGKEFKWWGASTDKSDWHINLEEGLMTLSANGQKQIEKAIDEMISKNVDNTELIVASAQGPLTRKAWPQNAEPTEPRTGQTLDREP